MAGKNRGKVPTEQEPQSGNGPRNTLGSPREPNTFQKSGKDFSTQRSSRIRTPGVTNPATAKLIAIR